jgi:hypothetical protein
MEKYYHYSGESGGNGIGFGAAAAVGVALANRAHGRLTVTIQPDGDLMMGPGILWTAAHHKIPILYVMHNNRAYHQEYMGLQKMANRRMRGIDTAYIGTTLRAFIDYAPSRRDWAFMLRGRSPIPGFRRSAGRATGRQDGAAPRSLTCHEGADPRPQAQ